MKTLLCAILIAVMVVVVVFQLYVGFAFAVFQYRNPKANNMSVWRDFDAVTRFQTLDKYQ